LGFPVFVWFVFLEVYIPPLVALSSRLPPLAGNVSFHPPNTPTPQVYMEANGVDIAAAIDDDVVSAAVATTQDDGAFSVEHYVLVWIAIVLTYYWGQQVRNARARWGTGRCGVGWLLVERGTQPCWGLFCFFFCNPPPPPPFLLPVVRR
jgi:hypothetical protein